jgi:hypothetical protein
MNAKGPAHAVLERGTRCAGLGWSVDHKALDRDDGIIERGDPGMASTSEKVANPFARALELARKHHVFRAPSLMSAEQLDALAADGWLLIEIVYNPKDENFYFYFRRQG